MTIRVRPLALLFLLLAAAAASPLSVAASWAPPAEHPAALATTACPLAVNTEITNVSAIVPTRVDVLANDCAGAATASRPLRITAVHQGTYGSVTTDGATITYDPRGCATGDAHGNDFVSYTISDGAASKTGIAAIHVVRPGSSPLTDLPQAGFVANSKIGSTIPLRVSWCGVPASGTGVKGYRVEQGTNAGATFPTLVTSATTSTSTIRGAAPNVAYAWRVRTTDSKGRTGGFAASLTSLVRVVQDTSSSIRYSTGWSTASGSKYSGGKEHFTSKAGATATLTVTNARAFAVVASKSSARGSFNVYVDGVRATSTAISEKASTAVWRRVLYIRGLSSGAGVAHTVQIRASGNGRIDLDAILTLSGKRDQAVTFTTGAPAAIYHGPAYPVAATASSGLPVSLSINQASWAVCSLSAGSVTFLKPGSCRIDASQSGDPTWNARTSSQTFTVAPIALAVTGMTALDRTYDGTTAATVDTSLAALNTAPVVAGDVVALNASGATGAFTPDGDAGPGKTVQVAGLALTGAAAGKYTITQPTTHASIGQRGLTVTFIAGTRPYDGTTGASITSCSVATVLGTDAVACDHSAATASFGDANAGTGKAVTASGFALTGAGAGNYTIAGVTPATGTITKAPQTISFTSAAPIGANPGATYTPSATATSGLPVDITVDPSAAAVCHKTAGVVTADAEGICVLVANQDGDANRAAAAEVPQTFAVGTPTAQTISFDLSAVNATYGDAPVTISATATSGLAVGFAAQTPTVCTVSGSDVTILAAGQCKIRASQPGDATWAPAPDVDRSFTVDQRPITVTAVTDTRTFDGTTTSDSVPLLTGSLAAGDTATWSQAFDTAAVGTGKTLTPSGTVAHGATDVTDDYVITFVPVTTGVIEVGTNAISFDLSAVTATYGDAPVTISATATSGLPVSFASQTAAVCTVSGSDVTVLAAGLCTIRASQPGDTTWAAAPDVDQSFTVDPRPITVTAVTDTRTFDGTTASDGVPLLTVGSLAAGDTATWTQAFDTPAVGTGKTITPSGTVVHGVTNVTADYLITFTPVTTGVIGPGPASLATSTVKATPPNVVGDGAHTTTITVRLRDAGNALLIASGGTVAIFADHGSVGTVLDHGDGSYTATYTSDTFLGDVTVSAELDGQPLEATVIINQH